MDRLSSIPPLGAIFSVIRRMIGASSEAAPPRHGRVALLTVGLVIDIRVLLTHVRLAHFRGRWPEHPRGGTLWCAPMTCYDHQGFLLRSVNGE